MSVVLLGIARLQHAANVPNPVSFAVGKIASLHWLVPIIDVGASVGLASTIFVGLYGQSRIFYSMARDGFLPPDVRGRASALPHAASRHHHHRHLRRPAIAAFFPLDFLGRRWSPSARCWPSSSVCVGIMILRIQAPNAKRPFRTPYVWFVAPLGIFICGAMMVSLPIRHLVAAGRVDGGRHRHLLRLRRPACGAVEVESCEERLIAGRDLID